MPSPTKKEEEGENGEKEGRGREKLACAMQPQGLSGLSWKRENSDPV